jgi:hypothetical protein
MPGPLSSVQQVLIFITSSNSTAHLEEKDLTIAAITTAAF